MTAMNRGVSDRHQELIEQPSKGQESTPIFGVVSTLDAVRDNVLRLLAGFPHPPSVLRVRIGDIAVDAEWPVGQPVAAPTIPAMATAMSSPQLADEVDTTANLADNRRYLCAPTVGVFFRAPEPGAKPFVDVGDAVRPEQQVAIIEAMKLMIPVEADMGGTIVEILKENSEPVEYGEPLFAYTPVEP